MCSQLRTIRTQQVAASSTAVRCAAGKQQEAGGPDTGSIGGVESFS